MKTVTNNQVAVARLHNYAKPQLAKALAMVQATVGGKARLLASSARGIAALH